MSADGGSLRLHELALLPVRWSGLAVAAGFAVLGMWVEAAVAMLVALAQVVGWRSRLPLPWEVATSAGRMIAAISSFLLFGRRCPAVASDQGSAVVTAGGCDRAVR